MYGSRARIGYTSPPMLTEVFARDFYRVMPADVSLVLTTLAILEMNTSEIDQSLKIARSVAKEMARAGVSLVVLGGVPINLSAAGPAGVDNLIDETRQQCGVPVTSSLTAQMKALKALGSKRVAVVQPFEASHASSYSYLNHFGFENLGVASAGSPAIDLGQLSSDIPVQLAHEIKKMHPEADTVYFPCPHWAIVDRIEEIEHDLGVNVVTAGQAIFWDALRCCSLPDKITGYGRLLEEH